MNDPVATERLTAFAARVEALPPEAWLRIAERCAEVDDKTLGGLLARVELYSRAWTPAVDPYARPLVEPTMAVLGGMFGLLAEVTAAVFPSSASDFEPPVVRDGSATNMPPALDAYLRVERVAQREQGAHPGSAAALRAVALGLSTRTPPGSLTALYRPFEPEIALSSLASAGDEHAV